MRKKERESESLMRYTAIASVTLCTDRIPLIFACRIRLRENGSNWRFFDVSEVSEVSVSMKKCL